MKAAVQVLKQAENYKDKVSGDILNDNEAWTSHQKLQDLYQQLLIMDLEYALDKKVEQDLWNYVFKNQISALQNQAKEKKNPRRTESQGNLAWFLEAASGFYLQLLQELCDAFDLDLPCRRKGSIYGIIKGSKKINYNITPPQKSSCFYVCQHCLVHLGDIARYRSQSLQAETFYRHAAQLVPSNGQPYNQLAILEAAKGEKLSMVFYYVRSIAVKHPFPVASTNLQKMFAKISADDLNTEGKTKLSVYDYINTFLQFHGIIHMSSDLEKASKLVKVLASNLSTLIATESLSSWKLIQMIAINLFAISHTTHALEGQNNSISENCLSDDEIKIFNLMLELLASVLNGILLLVYTMKDENNFKDYYALPVVKLILDWVQQDADVLRSQPFANKLQIWPSLCKLLNGIQIGTRENFDATKYQDVPLPEDWDLQCFLPLAKVHKQYKFKETTPRLTEEEETKLRTYRLLLHGKWICEQEILGKRLMTCSASQTGEIPNLSFEAIIQQAPSTEILLQLEEVSVSKGVSRNGHLHVENFGDSSSNSVGSQETTTHVQDRSENSEYYGNKGQENCLPGGKKGESKVHRAVIDGKDKRNDKSGVSKENSRPASYGRERKLRQNVAMQTIMQKKYTSPKHEMNDNFKPKIESKQVTFKTPSPSPPASSEGTPPQLSTTPQPTPNARADNLITGSYSALQSVYNPMNSFGNQKNSMNYNTQQVENKNSGNSMPFPPNRIAINFSGTLPNQSATLQDSVSSVTSNFTSNRMVYSTLPSTSTVFSSFNTTQSNPQYQLKEPLKTQPPRGNVMPLNVVSQPNPPQQQQQQAPQQPTLSSYIFSTPSKQNFNPFPESDLTPSIYTQQVQWFQQPPPPPPTTLDAFFSSSLPPRSEITSQNLTSAQPPQLQNLSSNFHPVYPNPAHQPAPPPINMQTSQPLNSLGENMIFQIQNSPSASALGYGCSPAPSLPSLNLGKNEMIGGSSGGGGTKLAATPRLDGEMTGNVLGEEMITNTYSLFNSPWSSGINPASTVNSAANEETFGVSLNVTNQTPTSASNFSSFMQPGLQSLWSGPTPSPLERLLEQQKQKRDTAPQ